jgi:hypothetical protein
MFRDLISASPAQRSSLQLCTTTSRDEIRSTSQSASSASEAEAAAERSQTGNASWLSCVLAHPDGLMRTEASKSTHLKSLSGAVGVRLRGLKQYCISCSASV